VAAILRWMIDGCQSWQDSGLTPPKAVLEATDKYLAVDGGEDPRLFGGGDIF